MTTVVKRRRPRRSYRADSCWHKFARARDEAIANTVWYRHWKLRRKVKPGTRVRIPDGMLHTSCFGLIGKMYLCGRSVEGRKIAEASGIRLPVALLCKRCLRLLLIDQGIK